MSSSLDHVIRGGQKYFSLVEECLQITNPFLDWRYLAPFWRNGQKKSENREILANFDSPKKFVGGRQNFKTSFGYSFSGTIARKSSDHAP